MRISIRSAMLRALLGAGLAASSLLAVGAGTANATAITCAPLRSVHATFQTGGDDLRSNSEVIMYLMSTLGDVELQHFYGGFGNNTTNSRDLGLLNPNFTVDSCAVTGLKIRMISHNGTFQSTDNWNLDAVSVSGYGNDGAYIWYFSKTGSPLLKRFTGSSQWWQANG